MIIIIAISFGLRRESWLKMTWFSSKIDMQKTVLLIPETVETSIQLFTGKDNYTFKLVFC